MTERSARSPGDLIVIALFAVLLLTPAVLALTGHAGFDTEFLRNNENRLPFVAPPVTTGALATGGWERDAEREIADAFPLRKQLITGFDFAKYVWLHDVTSSMVMRGKDSWLFLGAEEERYLQGAPDDAALRHLADVYASRAAWCKAHGMRYVFVLVPNKSTVYPQYLPPATSRVTPSAADRLLPLLAARGLTAIDVRGALLDLSKTTPVFSRFDTHWNDAGAYVAYRATIASLHDAGVRDTIDFATVRPHMEPGGADLLALSGVAGLAPNPWLLYDFPRHAQEIMVPDYPNDPDLAHFARHASIVANPSLRKAVFFGDSFLEQPRPFFAEDFRRAIFLHHSSVTDQQFDRHVLEAEAPDIVIQELIERSLVFANEFKP